MTKLIFFYGTLMTAFKRPERLRLDDQLTPIGRGWIDASLFDLGLYPAALPAADRRVRGEVHRMLDADAVFRALDQFEGYRANEPNASLYTRAQAEVTLDEGQRATAWVYFYNAPIGQAERIESGDYLAHSKTK